MLPVVSQNHLLYASMYIPVSGIIVDANAVGAHERTNQRGVCINVITFQGPKVPTKEILDHQICSRLAALF